MATYQETVRQGNDLTTTWKVFDAGGLLDYTIKDSDYGNDGVVDQRETTDYSYDASGRHTGDVYSLDYGADGFVEYQSFGTRQYNEAGQLIVDLDDSQDWDGDGNPDYSNVTSYAYNASGQTTSIETVYLFNGTPNGIDYAIQTFSFNARGLLYEHFTDDWSTQDFPIGFRHTYDSSNRLIKTQMQNEFEFGDQNWRTEDTYKWSGSKLIESNQYGEWFNGTYVLEIKNKMSYDSAGNLSKEVITGQNHSWQTVERMQVEHWYLEGLETTRLTSYDENLDGVFDAGTRTLERFSYHSDGQLASHTIDYNTGDSIIEYSMTNELLVA